MDALDVIKVCLRRWYVALPVLLLAIGAGWGLASHQQPTYQAFGTYAIVYKDSSRSDQVRSPVEANPLAPQGGALLGEAVAADLMSDTSQATLGRAGNSGVAPGEPENSSSYSVTLPQGSQSYLVQTWGPDPVASAKIVDAVIAAVPLRAEQIQDRAGAPRRSQFTTFTTSATQVVQLPETSRVKLIGAIAAVGILAGSALSIVTDRLFERRGRRHEPKDTLSSSGGQKSIGPTTASDSVAGVKADKRSAVPAIEVLSDIPPEVSQESAPPAETANPSVPAPEQTATVGGDAASMFEERDISPAPEFPLYEFEERDISPAPEFPLYEFATRDQPESGDAAERHEPFEGKPKQWPSDGPHNQRSVVEDATVTNLSPVPEYTLAAPYSGRVDLDHLAKATNNSRIKPPQVRGSH